VEDRARSRAAAPATVEEAYRKLRPAAVASREEATSLAEANHKAQVARWRATIVEGSNAKALIDQFKPPGSVVYWIRQEAWSTGYAAFRVYFWGQYVKQFNVTERGQDEALQESLEAAWRASERATGRRPPPEVIAKIREIRNVSTED